MVLPAANFCQFDSGHSQELDRYLPGCRKTRRSRYECEARDCRLPLETNIHIRPAEIIDRRQFGKWEGHVTILKRAYPNARDAISFVGTTKTTQSLLTAR